MKKIITKKNLVLALVLSLIITSDHASAAKRKADEDASALEQQAEKKQKPELKICSACTYDKNAADAITCEICNTEFLHEIEDEKEEKENKEAHTEPEEIRCNVCLDALHGEENLPVLALPKHGPICGHEFHRKCLVSSLSEQSRCPYCRAAVDLAATAIGLTEDELTRINEGLRRVEVEKEATNRQVAVENEHYGILVDELLEAINQNDDDNVEELLEENEFDQKDLQNALILAVQNDNVYLMSLIIKAGGDINYKASTGNSMLMLAAYHGAQNTLKKLLDIGANIDDVNSENGSAFMFALHRNHLDVAKILISYGADINIITEGKSSLVLAVQSQSYHEALSLLLSKASALNIKILISLLCSTKNLAHRYEIERLLLGHLKNGLCLNDEAVKILANGLFNYAIVNDNVNMAQQLIDHEKLNRFNQHFITAASVSHDIVKLLLSSNRTKNALTATGALDAFSAANTGKNLATYKCLIDSEIIKQVIKSNLFECKAWIRKTILSDDHENIDSFLSGTLTKNLINENFFKELFIEAVQKQKINAIFRLVNHKHATTSLCSHALTIPSNEGIKRFLQLKLSSLQSGN